MRENVAAMWMDVYSAGRRRIASIEVDPAEPPTVVHPRGAAVIEGEQYLDWDRAFDDEGRLRKCPVCNCPDLFMRRLVPPLNGFIVVLAVGLLSLALWGLTSAPLGLVLGVLGVVVAANLLIVYRMPRFLQCYRCASRFHDVPMPRERSDYDAGLAERYRVETPPPRPSRDPHADVTGLDGSAGGTAGDEP